MCWHKPCINCVICEYFLLVLWHVCSFFMVLEKQQFLALMHSSLSVFSFMDHAFDVIPKKFLLNAELFSSRRDIILAFT